MPSNHPITVHSWADSHLPNINPLVRIDHQFTPEAAAAAAISKLLAKPPGCKAIQHWQSLIIDVPSNRNSFTLPPNIDTIVAALRSGPDISLPLAWTRKLYQRLASAGVVPDWIVCDEEGGWNYWQLVQIIGERQSMPLFEKIFADPLIRAKMPSDLLAFSPRDFNSASRHYHKAVLAWCLWTGKITGDAMRKVILDTATETFGVTPNASNFGDLIMSFQTYDVNGWERFAQESRLSNWASPAIYLVPGNLDNFGRKKHPCWNRFINNLNDVRSCIIGSNRLSGSTDTAPNVAPHVAPWLSHPSISGDHAHRSPLSMRWLWTEQMHHVHATGVNTFLYWNPAEIKTLDPRADDQFASEIFKDLATRPATVRTLGEIPLDADQVISGNYITTYQEFEKNFPVE